MSNSPVDNVLGRLEAVKRSGSGWRARCPAHEDRTPSLSIAEGADGRVLVKCMAGCELDDVTSALGMTTADLFADEGKASKPEIVETYAYHDADGELLFEVVRYSPKAFKQRRPDGNGGWTWSLGKTPRVLFRLPVVLAKAKAGGAVWVAEGERDALALTAAGCAATCNSGGAGKWRDSYSESLVGSEVTIVADADEPGRKHAAAVRDSLARHGVSCRVVEAAVGKDASDHLKAGKTIAEFVEVEVVAAEPVDLDALDPGDAVNCTQLGNARRFALLHGDAARYDPGRGWMVYDDAQGIWRADQLRAETLAKRIPSSVLGEALQERDDDRRKALTKWALASETRATIMAGLELARSEPGVAALADDFDADPDLVCAADCIIDTRTGDRRPHDPAAMMTRRLGTAYDPGAACPLWTDHLETVTAGRESLARFLAEFFGMSLTGHTFEQCLAILYGIGANGKSVTLETVRAAAGTYASNADASTFMAKRDDSSSGLARLAGARLVTAAETGTSHRLDEALVKQVTGSEPVTARFLYHEHFEFTPRFKLVLSTNHKPRVTGTDHGIWRRIRLVPFDVVIPDAEQDHRLAERLRDELPGVLAWMVAGCLEWRQHGLTMPDEVRDATACYQLEMDPLASFLEARTVAEDGASVTAGLLYQDYRAWSEETGDTPMSQRAFSARLTERGVNHSGRRDNAGRYLYAGLRLRKGVNGSDV